MTFPFGAKEVTSIVENILRKVNFPPGIGPKLMVEELQSGENTLELF